MQGMRVYASGVPRAMRHLEELGAKALRMQPGIHAGAEILKEGLHRQFQSHGAAFGGGWAPLAAATLETKARGGGEIMRATGALEQRIAEVTKFSPVSAEIGTRDIVAKFHQGGTDKMPKREVVGIATSDRGKVLVALRRALLTHV